MDASSLNRAEARTLGSTVI